MGADPTVEELADVRALMRLVIEVFDDEQRNFDEHFIPMHESSDHSVTIR